MQLGEGRQTRPAKAVDRLVRPVPHCAVLRALLSRFSGMISAGSEDRPSYAACSQCCVR